MTPIGFKNFLNQHSFCDIIGNRNFWHNSDMKIGVEASHPLRNYLYYLCYTDLNYGGYPENWFKDQPHFLKYDNIYLHEKNYMDESNLPPWASRFREFIPPSESPLIMIRECLHVYEEFEGK